MDRREGYIANVDDFYEIYNWKPPRHKIVCPTCRGEGTHVDPNIDHNGILPEEFIEDPDFEDAYFSGTFDVRCNECHGLRVVDEVEVDKLTDSELKEWLGYLQSVYEDRSAIAAERRMGC